jgi:cobalt-precorrin 5A hydrolase
VIVAGFGFRAGADLAALRAALTLAQEGLPPVTALATLDDKAPLVERLGDAIGLRVIAVSAERVAATPTPTQSPASLRARGTGSVAEACALAGAGPQARLLVTRRVSPDGTATCAIAQGPAA